MLSVVRWPLWSRFQGFNRKGVPETELPGGNMPFRSNNEGVINKIWEWFHCSKRWINISSQLKVLDSLRVCFLRRTSINQSLFVFLTWEKQAEQEANNPRSHLWFLFCLVWFLSFFFFFQTKKEIRYENVHHDGLDFFTRPLPGPQG